MKTLLALVDTYNHERFIARATESVLAQVLPPGWAMHVVVVDDGSTDKTPEMLRPYQDRIRYLRKENGGQASAFNQLQQLPSSDLVAFLDGDDYWLPGKLQAVIAEFEAEPALVAVGHGFREVREDETAIRAVVPSARRTYEFVRNADLADYFEYRCCLGTSRLAVRRQALDALLPVPEGLVYEADEYWFSLLPALGLVRVLPQVLTAYRLHGGNLYQSALQEPRRVQTRKQIHQVLLDTVPARLRMLRAPEPVVTGLSVALKFHIDDLRLALGELSRRQAMRHEWQRFRTRPCHTARSAVMCVVAMVSSGVLPGPRHVQLRNGYSRMLNREHE